MVSRTFGQVIATHLYYWVEKEKMGLVCFSRGPCLLKASLLQEARIATSTAVSTRSNESDSDMESNLER